MFANDTMIKNARCICLLMSPLSVVPTHSLKTAAFILFLLAEECSITVFFSIARFTKYKIGVQGCSQKTLRFCIHSK